jgi:hypothetical protein
MPIYSIEHNPLPLPINQPLVSGRNLRLDSADVALKDASGTRARNSAALDPKEAA